MFEDINVWAATADWAEIIVNLLLFVAPLALAFAGVFLSGTAFWASFKALVRTARSSFDEATDPAVVWLAQLTKLPAETVAKIFVGLMDAILTSPEARATLEASGWAIPTTTGVNITDQPPPQEVNIGETADLPVQSSTLQWLDNLPPSALERLAAILESTPVPPTPAGTPPPEGYAGEDAAGDAP